MTVEGQRYGHILNPKTGWPDPGLRAVSVIGPQCLIAGSTYTIGMLLGDNGNDWLDDVGLPIYGLMLIVGSMSATTHRHKTGPCRGHFPC